MKPDEAAPGVVYNQRDEVLEGGALLVNICQTPHCERRQISFMRIHWWIFNVYLIIAIVILHAVEFGLCEAGGFLAVHVDFVYVII